MRCPECALGLEFVTDGTYRCKTCKWFGVIISTDDIFNYLLTHKKEVLMEYWAENGDGGTQIEYKYTG